MSIDTPAADGHLRSLTAHEARRRLEHARGTRLVQLEAVNENGHPADDQLMSAQRTAIERVLREIDDAFARVTAGTYGTCENCAKPVPVERLEILPYTRYCVTCRRVAP